MLGREAIRVAARRRKTSIGRAGPRTSARARSDPGAGARAALRTALRPRWAPAWLAALGGAVLVAVFTAGLGLGISPDSASYLSAAQSVGQGFADCDGSAYSSWPPLLPLLLSAPRGLGLDPVGVARIAQLLLHAACLGLLVAWGIRRGLSTPVAYALAAAMVLVAPPLRAAAMLWSELLFTALCLLSLERLVAWQETDDRRAWGLAVMAAALAALTRYAGVALLLGGALYLLSAPGRAWRIRLRRALFFALPASLPLLLWMLRNLDLGLGPTGPRYPAMLRARQVLDFLGDPLPRLYLPEAWSGGLPGSVWLIGFVLAWALLLGWHWRARRPGAVGHESGVAVLLFVGAFVALLAVAVASNGMDRPNFRLLAPVVLPSLLGVALLGTGEGSPRSDRMCRRVALSLLVLVALFGAIRLPVEFHEFRTQGAGYALPRYQDSPLAREIRARDLRGELMSNVPPEVYYLCGIRSWWPPREKAYQSHNLEIQTEELRDFERRVKSTGGGRGLYLAWFNESPPFLFELATLRSIYQVMTPVAEVEDGILLFVPSFEGSAVD
jgi:hypothetical protein